MKSLIIISLIITFIGVFCSAYNFEYDDYSDYENEGNDATPDDTIVKDSQDTSTTETTIEAGGNKETNSSSEIPSSTVHGGTENEEHSELEKLVLAEKWKPFVESFKNYCMNQHRINNDTIELLHQKNWNNTESNNNTKCFTACYLRTLDIYEKNYLLPGRFEASFEFTHEFTNLLTNTGCKECKKGDEDFLKYLKTKVIDMVMESCRNNTEEFKKQDYCTKGFHMFQCLMNNDIELL